MAQRRNFFGNPVPFSYLAGVGDRVSYAFFSGEGDLLVPIRSATGASRKPSRRLHFNDADGRIFFGMNHFEIMNHPQVYTALSEWLHGKSRGRLRQRVKQAMGS